MPEGPEIRKAADMIENALVHRVLEKVYFAFDHLKPFAAQMTGAQVTAVETRGKAMLIHTSCDLSIYSHNQLYGRWMVRSPDDMPATRRQLRLALHNACHSAFLFSASDIEVLDADGIALHPFLSRLGPDIMSAGAEEIKARFLAQRFSRRRLGQLLLDQGFLAGVGNYLRSEILFSAGIHPGKRPCDCSDRELAALASACLALARQSYEHNGVTLNTDLARQLKASGVKRKDYRHWVFGRENQPCWQCQTSVRKTTVASRRLYFCSGCQPGSL